MDFADPKFLARGVSMMFSHKKPNSGKTYGKPKRDEKMSLLKQGTRFDNLDIENSSENIQTLHEKQSHSRIRRDDCKPIIWFSAELCPLLGMSRTEQRIVIITKYAVHLLERLERSILSPDDGPTITTKCYRYRFLWVFKVSDTEAIIESEIDTNTLCLDIRQETKVDGKLVRQSVLRDVTDPGYMVFSLREKKGGKEEMISVLKRLSPTVEITSLERPIRTAADVLRVISESSMNRKVESLDTSVALMPTKRAADDTLQLAQKAATVRALKNEGDHIILFSLQVSVLKRSGALKGSMALIITDKAVYYNSIPPNTEEIIRRVDLQNIRQIIIEKQKEKSDDKVEKHWDLLLRIDLANDTSKDLSSDMLFRLERRIQRDAVVHALQTAYEQLVTEKLYCGYSNSIHWSKRGKLEAIIHSVMPQQPNRKSLLDQRSEESLAWLVYLIKNHLRYILLIMQDVIPLEISEILCHSLHKLCEDNGLTEQLLRDAIDVELRRPVNTILRSSTIPVTIFRLSIGDGIKERYEKVTLFKLTQELVSKNPDLPEDDKFKPGTEHILWEWLDEFYDRITQIDLVPYGLEQFMRVFVTGCAARGVDPVKPAGLYLVVKIIIPALVAGAMGRGTRTENRVKKIAEVFQCLVNRQTASANQNGPELKASIDRWLDLRGFGIPVQLPDNYKSTKIITWTAYINQFSSAAPVVPVETPNTTRTLLDVETLVQDPDFTSGYDKIILTHMHKVLVDYAEQNLCYFWTTTGKRKQIYEELLDLEVRCDRERDFRSFGSGLLFPHADSSGHSPVGSDYGGSPAARSPMGLKGKNHYFNKRSSLACTPLQAMSPRRTKSPTINFEDFLGAAPAFGSRRRAGRSLPREPLPRYDASRELNYLNHLRGLARTRSKQIEELVCKKSELKQTLARLREEQKRRQSN